MKKLLLIIILIPFLTSCTSPQKKFEQKIQSGNCSQAFKDMPRNDHRIQFLGDVQDGATTGLSYALSGAGYTVDFMTSIVSGVAVLTIFCAPGMLTLAALSAASSTPVSGGKINALCFEKDAQKYIYNPKLGKKTFRNTQNWRCPDFSTVAQAFQKVSSCYQSKKTPEARKQALQTLELLQKNVLFYECLKSKDRQKIGQQLNELREAQ